ncbi:LOW QUALITY PROTEIN: centrosomal protein of 120 kDa [Scomber japonicus]|uniref:LOW QUALITY PROTEIN: centrosomal protein of 120 kDa n=1 Tax=Scomber japonicus TaxID=13676 RepID=UPI0023068BA8|nr:LOW QUALITY PROTEIN: centrosomal protein of 120 kDa [Scomber japonicus]
MSSKSDQLLIVVSILEGRHFPKTPRLSLVVQASFDGEQLATDPVEHRDQPQFSTELAWELDRRTLHQHRLQRTPIKLQCFAVDSVSNRKENVGYIVLDLRSVQEVRQLIPSTTKLSAEGSEFFFYYCLLGNDITSEPFHNLLSPDFEPERASVRIRSSKQILNAFLSQLHGLEIHLCCGNHSLGSAAVSLSSLSTVSVDLDHKAATVEGAFILQPPKRIKRTQPALPADLQPTVGVAVTLRREEVAPQSLGKKGGGAAQTLSVPPPPPPSRPRSSSPVRKPRASSSPPPPPAAAAASSHTESEAESLLEELQRAKEPAALEAADLELPVHTRTEAAAAEGAAEGGASSVSVSAPKVSIPSSAHHYCFSLDLQRLGKLSTTHPIAATLRYSYQFFGSAAPIMTNPPVELQRNSEVSLPQSYCAFDFAALPQQLEETFLRVPLVVELWHRDSSSDQLIGRASVQLSHLLSSERSRLQGSTGEPSWRQTHHDRIPVVRKHRPSEKVAELSYVATLEDLGLVKAREVIVSDSTQSEPAALGPSSPPPPSRPPAPPPGPSAPTAPRDTLEYRTALELELWKEEQEDLFDDQLKKKELIHMQALAEEWKKRDREREALVKKKEVEYNLLEEQLQKTLCDLEKREKQLAEAELETQRLQRELRSEHDLTQKELQEGSRRLQQEFDHRVALERDKARLMEEERARLLQQITDGESRYKQLEKEFNVYREQQNIRPEFRLQSEVNLLTLEKVELERKLESTTKSKLHYKQQWGRALKELARFKQKKQEEEIANLKREYEEEMQMKMKKIEQERAEKDKALKTEKNYERNKRLGKRNKKKCGRNEIKKINGEKRKSKHDLTS